MKKKLWGCLWLPCVFLLFTLLIPMYGRAGSDPDFTIEIPMVGSTTKEIRSSLPRALQAWVERQSHIDPHVSMSMTRFVNVEELVHEYHLVRLPDEQGKFLLHVEFEPELLSSRLNLAALPFQKSFSSKDDAPANIVVWLIREEGPQAEFLTGESEARIASLLSEWAQTHGVSVVFPLGDLEDLQSMSISELQALKVPNILQASLRYHSNTPLVIRLIPYGSAFLRGKGAILVGNRVFQINASGEDEASILNQLLSESCEVLKREGVKV